MCDYYGFRFDPRTRLERLHLQLVNVYGPGVDAVAWARLDMVVRMVASKRKEAPPVPKDTIDAAGIRGKWQCVVDKQGERRRTFANHVKPDELVVVAGAETLGAFLEYVSFSADAVYQAYVEEMARAAARVARDMRFSPDSPGWQDIHTYICGAETLERVSARAQDLMSEEYDLLGFNQRPGST